MLWVFCHLQYVLLCCLVWLHCCFLLEIPDQSRGRLSWGKSVECVCLEYIHESQADHHLDFQVNSRMDIHEGWFPHNHLEVCRDHQVDKTLWKKLWKRSVYFSKFNHSLNFTSPTQNVRRRSLKSFSGKKKKVKVMILVKVKYLHI